jgi:hypothetical protein
MAVDALVELMYIQNKSFLPAIQSSFSADHIKHFVAQILEGESLGSRGIFNSVVLQTGSLADDM